MKKPAPKFKEGTKVRDPEHDEEYEFCYKTDWEVQDRLVPA